VLNALTISGTAQLDVSASNYALSVGGNWTVTSANADPFVERNGIVTLNGSTTVQTISNPIAGGEKFYDLVINHTSPLRPGLTSDININISHDHTHTRGSLDMLGNDFIITGSAANTTQQFTDGDIYSSLPGTDFTVTDPSTNVTMQFDGTTFGSPAQDITITVTTANSYFDGSDFYGPAVFTKTGASGNDTQGGCLFTGPVTFNTVVGGDRWRMANSQPDIFYNATFNHDGNNNFIVARQTTGNEFFGTTTINSSTVGGFYVGRSNTASNGEATFHGPVVISVTLSGNVNFAESNATIQNDVTFESTIQINSTATSTGDVRFGTNDFGSTTITGAGQFIAGTVLGATTIRLYRVTENSGLPQTISCDPSGTAHIECGANSLGNGAQFTGAVDFYAPRVSLRFSTFNGMGNVFTNSGTVANTTWGGNIFNGSSTFNLTGTGNWTWGGSGGDDFNADATFVRAGTGRFLVANTNTTTFSRNISTAGGTGIVEFADAASGLIVIDGVGVQTFNGNAGLEPTIGNMQMNNAAGMVMNVGAIIESDLTFTNGVITNGTNTLVFNDNATATTPSSASFVDGEVRKIGNDVFTFPVGNNGLFAPLSMSNPSNTTHHFTCRHFDIDPNVPGYDTALHVPSIDHVSACEYWILDRTNGTSNVTVDLSYDTPRSCTVDAPADLLVARWDGAQWQNQGNGGNPGILGFGSVISNGAVTSFSPFTLASITAQNPLPVELIDLRAVVTGKDIQVLWATASEFNNSHFVVERSADGVSFAAIGEVAGNGNATSLNQYLFVDTNPVQGVNYYRLRQIDFDGTEDITMVVSAMLSASQELVLYPNPAQGEVRIAGIDYSTEVVVLDASGRAVARFIPAAGIIGISGLPNGAYFVVAEGRTQRLLIGR
jgi:hypothetical protein